MRETVSQERSSSMAYPAYRLPMRRTYADQSQKSLVRHKVALTLGPVHPSAAKVVGIRQTLPQAYSFSCFRLV
jgi:hypothetical protein